MTFFQPNEKPEEALRNLFGKHGIQVAPQRQILFNPRLGRLMVRAKLDELDQIERVIQNLNQAQQIRIDIRIAEVSPGPTPVLQPDLRSDAGLAGSLRLNSFSALPRDLNGIFTYEALGNGRFVTNRSPATNCVSVKGVLGETELTQVIKALDQHAGTDILTMPSSICPSGQLILIDPFQLTSQPNFIRPCGGPVLNVFAELSPKGDIHMAISGSVFEFIGDAGEPNYVGGANRPSKQTPIFRVRQANDRMD